MATDKSKEAMKLLEALRVNYSDVVCEQSSRLAGYFEDDIAALREALEKEALHKLASKSLNEGLSLDDWNKIGCVNHDCDKCKAEQPAQQQEPICKLFGTLPVYDRAAQQEQNRQIDQLIQERDHRDEIIDKLCDAVLGPDRYEWSSQYFFEDAVREVEERMAEQPAQQEQESWEDLHNALQRIDTAAVGLPTFEVRHEGGLDAVTQNIVDAITALHTQPAQQEPEFFTHSVERPYDWSEWVCPDPKSYLMKCCDCGLVHEAQFGVVRYKSETEREDCEPVDDPNLQAVFRMRRSEQWSPEDTAHRAGGLPMEQPAQQEPVGWWDDELGFFAEKHFDQLQPIYKSPPQRTWVGLTDEEIEAEFGFIDELMRHCCYRIEAKLREKNNGN